LTRSGPAPREAGARGGRGSRWAAIRLARPVNCLMSGLAAVLGMLAGGAVSWWAAGWSTTCTVLVTAGGNTLNDHQDVEADRMSHPERPLPMGQIGRAAALSLALGEIAVAVALGWLVSSLFGLIVLIAVLTLLAYEWRLKAEGLPGNVAIGCLVGLAFVGGGAAAGDPWPSAGLGVLAAVAASGREIAKDIVDAPGDSARRTWPMRVGVERAGRGAAILLAAAVLLSPVPYLLGTLSVWYLAAVLAPDLMLAWAIRLLPSRPARAERLVKVGMLGVLGAFLVGVLT